MSFHNTYLDGARAEAYAELDFGGTYRLAADCLTRMLATHVSGTSALDFGCGTGRSARLLQALGYQTIGIDVSQQMVAIARRNDPCGDYRVIGDGDFSGLKTGSFALILCAFPFDNIASREQKVRLFAALGRLLAPRGRLVNIVSTPELYVNEWVTFTTRDFPRNRHARPGDPVLVVTKSYSDGRPVADILWPDAEYRSVYRASGLRLLDSDAPIATGAEGIEWVSETAIAPWRLYVLESAIPG